MTNTSNRTDTETPSLPVRLLHSILRLSSDVRRDEAVDTALFLTNIFLVLVAYYIIDTVRMPLILASGGAEMKSYAAAFQVPLLFAYIPLYGWLTKRVPRMKLNAGIVLFFFICIELFFLAGVAEVPNLFGLLIGVFPTAATPSLEWLMASINLGFVFYVWVGIFSVAVITQFWSYTNDIFDESTGKRLFPVIAVGANAGAPVGSATAGFLFDSGVSPFTMLQVSAGLLLVHLSLYWLAEKRCGADDPSANMAAAEHAQKDAPENIDTYTGGGFQLILQNRYLWWITIFFVLFNLVNTTGEYILSVFVEDAARAAVDAGDVASTETYIGSFYGEFYSVINVVALLVQIFLVSRILKWLGMSGMIFALPIVALGTYGLAAFGVGLAVFRWGMAAENSTDYSVMNTTRALLWLPTTRAEKYAAKQTIDTFFVRFGDVLSAGLVFVGTTWLQFQPQEFAYVNLALIGLWIGIGLLMLRSFWKRSEASGVTVEDLEASVS